MNHVLWIGGPPGAGKTTIATRLARRYGLRLYSADTRTWAHRDRALTAGNAAAHRWEQLRVENRWDDCTDDDLLAMSLHRERGEMVLDDLRALPTTPLIVAEGTTLPAASARPHAVWLLPREHEPASRLDRILTDVITAEAHAHALPQLAGYDAVERHFAAVIAQGPRAQTTDERRALLRAINEAIVAQVRAGHARPWAKGNPDAEIRTFVCECGDMNCDATFVRSIREYASEG